MMAFASPSESGNPIVPCSFKTNPGLGNSDTVCPQAKVLGPVISDRVSRISPLISSSVSGYSYSDDSGDEDAMVAEIEVVG